MAYLNFIGRLYRFDFSVFRPRELPPHPFAFTLAGVILTGLLYGGFALLFNMQYLGAFEDSLSRNITTALVLLSGVLVALILHAGAALFIWTFCRGVGGNTGLINYYVVTGFAVPLLWPAAPLLAAINSGVSNPLVFIALTVSLAAFLAALAASLKEVSGLSTARLATALSLTAVFVGCFLYLWL